MNIIKLAITAELIDQRDTAETLPPDFVEALNEFTALIRNAVLEEAEGAIRDIDALHSAGVVDVTIDAIRAMKEQT